MSEIRLQKIIAQAGVASRREAERLIAEGRVTVNGRAVTALGAKADPLADAVKVDGRLITRREAPVYLVMNKPRNVLTTLRDEEGKDRPTVADLLPGGRRRVFPIGRLDFDVEGVLLLTNDGELAHRLAHPRHQVARVYDAKVKGTPDARALERMESGAWARSGGGRGPRPEPARVRALSTKTTANAWLRIELHEGRHHQVKRMCEAVGHPVLKLVRRSFGGVTARGLAPGKVRTLSAPEVTRLKTLTGLAVPPAAPSPASKAGWARPKPSPSRRASKRGAATPKAGSPAKPRAKRSRT